MRGKLIDWLVVAFTVVEEDDECRKILAYRDGEGVFLERVDRKTLKRTPLPLDDAAIASIEPKWSAWMAYLSRAGVQNAEPATPCRSVSRASRGRAS